MPPLVSLRLSSFRCTRFTRSSWPWPTTSGDYTRASHHGITLRDLSPIYKAPQRPWDSRGGGSELAFAAAGAVVLLSEDEARTTRSESGPQSQSNWSSMGLLGPVLNSNAGHTPRRRVRDLPATLSDSVPGRARSTPTPSSPDNFPDPYALTTDLGFDLSLGTIAGFCAGYAIKKVSKFAAFAVGVGFITIQVARHHGYISDVDWAALESRMLSVWDADGDGRVTAADVRVHVKRAVDIVGFNIPSGAAFAAALILGFRVG